MNTIFDIRIKCGLSPEKMARLLGISTANYTKYERNPQETPCKVATKLSAITGISLDDIFFG